MRIIHRLRTMQPLEGPAVVTLGTFDGVHLGHQAIFKRVVELAERHGARSVAVTFEPHPRAVLGRPDEALLLTSMAHKLQLIEAQGIDVCVVVHFDRAFAQIEAAAFVEGLLAAKFDLRAVVIGSTNRFGKNASGDARFLQECGQRLGFDVEIVEPVRVDNIIANSTVVRTLVQGGELEQAAAFLGRPFSLFGTVVHGATRGRRVGYPTANLDPSNEVVPPSGVYAARVRLGRRVLGGVLNIGFRPTFEDPDEVSRAIEVHVFDFEGELYGRELEVIFLKKLREEIRFESVETLREQIRHDEREARRILGLPPRMEQATGPQPEPPAQRQEP
jgi:riboflavin kinase/FMN adenylyltransferase